MKSKKLWTILIFIIILAGVAFFFRDSLTPLVGGTTDQASAQGTRSAGITETVTIRPATNMNQVSAAGNIALSSQQEAVLLVQGVISQVRVKPGDHLATGDVLVSLDTTDLERAVQRAQLSLASSQNQLAQLKEPAKPADIEAAQANLAAAKESLAELEAGPSSTKLEAARTALAAAQASYQELLAGKDQAELTQLSAEMHKAYIALRQAQEAYNEIAYRDDIGKSQQAMDLQTATIDYDTAKAAYEVATESATPSQVQSALQAIQEAQAQVEDLMPTPAGLASAKAQVAADQATLDNLLNGPSEAELRTAELAIEQAKLDLEEAQANLDRAQLRAPLDGTILTVNVEVGQQASAGLSAVTMADLTNLELPVYVAEVDISKVQLGQPVGISVDALPNQVFNGEVSRIAPVSQSESGVVNYEVTIQLNDLRLEDGVRPGMTAVATIMGHNAENTWLVPSNALVEFEGETTVTIVRNGQKDQVAVTPGTVEGEWTAVHSPDLKAGDQVVGQVTSFVGQENRDSGPRGFFGGGGGRPPTR